MPVNDPARTRRFAATPDLIADSLRDEILRGVIEPGAPLRQEELAERFQVSRIPVRDALLRLESQGLVHVYPNRGAFVISLSADEVREIYDMRILLEGDLIERAVPRMTAEDWRRIDAAHAAATRTAGALIGRKVTGRFIARCTSQREELDSSNSSSCCARRSHGTRPGTAPCRNTR